RFLPRAADMATQWLRREGSKKAGYRFVDGEGRQVRDRATVKRAASIYVPPAWRDVHIARSARSAIQAWGYDVRGRKQYVYHDRAVVRRDLRKYHRMRQLAKELPGIRRA